MSKRTLEEIKRDLATYERLCKRGQGGATLYADKYVEDVGALVELLEASATVTIASKVPNFDPDKVAKAFAKTTKNKKAPKPK